ncbi:hypothetical protein ACFL2V_01580 [Pseudomonadota bacterium]
MKPPFKLKTLSLTMAALALTLSGCGGGGGGESSPSVTETSNTTGISGASLSGTAAKGIIKSGNVVAEELDSSGSVLRTVGSATTAADGSYEISVNSDYEGGPIQITISAGANTEMKCDIPAGCGARNDAIQDSNTDIDFAEWYKLGSLTMTALVAEAATNDKINVNVTPYTDLATRRAKASGTLNATAVYNANSEVSNLLGGIDILNTKAIDITDASAINGSAPTEIAYAAFGAAIAALADASQGSPDIDGALQTLFDSFASGTIAADDSASANDAQLMSLQELIDEAQSTYAQAGITDTSSIVATLQANVISANAGNGIIDPEASSTAGSAALSKVKALIGDVRTWGTVIDAESKSKGDAFAQQVELATDASDISREFLISPALGAAIEAILLNLDGTFSGAELSGYGLGFSSGTISRVNGVFTITDGVIGEGSVNMSVSIPEDGTTASSAITIGITSTTFRSAAADADINSGTIVLNLASPYTFNYAAIETDTAPDPDISGVSIDLDISLTQKQNGSGEALDAQVTFAGTLSTTLVNPIKDATNDYNWITVNEPTFDDYSLVTPGTFSDYYSWITPSTLALSGEISSSAGHRMEASFTANVNNASTFAPLGELPIGTITPDLVTWTNSDTDGVSGEDTFILNLVGNYAYSTSVYWSSSDNSATQTYTYSNGYSFSSNLGTYDSFADARNAATQNYSTMYPTTDEGMYHADLSSADFSVNGGASGALYSPAYNLEGTGDNQWLDADVGLSFSLQLDGMPEARVSVTGDRTGFDDGTAAISIAFGTRQIVINGTITDLGTTDNTVTGNIVITNQDGVTMTITPNEDDDYQTGMIEYNGTKYADVERLSSGLVKITYINGTFEIL